MYTTLSSASSSSQSSPITLNIGKVLLLFALLTHLMSWCFVTFLPTAIDSHPAANIMPVVWLARTLTLLGTSAWFASILCCAYATGPFAVFAASFIVIAVLMIAMLGVLAMI